MHSTCSCACVQGSRYLYDRFMRPAMLRYQPKVDMVLEKVTGVAAMLYSMYKVGAPGSPGCVLGARSTHDGRS